MFYLKQYDTELLSFEIDDMPLEGQKCRIVSVNEQSKTLFPIGMNPDNESLMKWLRGRVIPKNREYVDALLAKNGLAHGDTRGILRISCGLSLNDSYWITEDVLKEPITTVICTNTNLTQRSHSLPLPAQAVCI